jgi:hypothetical protein
MKKVLLGLMMALTVGSAQAALTIVNQSNVNFSGYDGQPATITGIFTSGQWGALSASVAGTFSATYLGNESGYTNAFFAFDGGVISLVETNDLGKTVSTDVNAGIIPFAFIDSVGSFFFNGSNQTPVLGFAIMDGRTTEQYGSFDYIIGFNDSFKSDADYDDFVIGVNFVAAAVPEPETYALMLVGLGIVGFTARSRKNKQA